MGETAVSPWVRPPTFNCFSTASIFTSSGHLPIDNGISSQTACPKRYVRSADLAETMALLDLVKVEFSNIDSGKIDWGDHSAPGRHSLLDPNLTHLSQIFARYFSAYADAADNATVTADLVETDPSYEYQAVRTCVIDILRFIEEEPLYPDAHGALEGPPIWRS